MTTMSLYTHPLQSTRRVPRYTTYLDAAVAIDGARAMGTILSISAGGLFLTTEARPSVGKSMAVRFAVDDSGEVELPGVVIYRAHSSGHWGVGIKFLEPEQAEAVIEALVFWLQLFQRPE